MSTTIIERVSDVQEQVIELLESVKEPVTKAVSTVSTFVSDRVEIRPIPYAQEVPSPKEVIDNQAKFASKLVTTNKAVALSAARAAAPVTDPLLARSTGRKTASSAKAAA